MLREFLNRENKITLFFIIQTNVQVKLGETSRSSTSNEEKKYFQGFRLNWRKKQSLQICDGVIASLPHVVGDGAFTAVSHSWHIRDQHVPRTINKETFWLSLTYKLFWDQDRLDSKFAEDLWLFNLCVLGEIYQIFEQSFFSSSFFHFTTIISLNSTG